MVITFDVVLLIDVEMKPMIVKEKQTNERTCAF